MSKLEQLAKRYTELEVIQEQIKYAGFFDSMFIKIAFSILGILVAILIGTLVVLVKEHYKLKKEGKDDNNKVDKWIFTGVTIIALCFIVIILVSVVETNNNKNILEEKGLDRVAREETIKNELKYAKEEYIKELEEGMTRREVEFISISQTGKMKFTEEGVEKTAYLDFKYGVNKYIDRELFVMEKEDNKTTPLTLIREGAKVEILEYKIDTESKELNKLDGYIQVREKGDEEE